MQRMRRLRVNENMRSLVRETSVEISDLVYPIFVEEGEKQPVNKLKQNTKGNNTINAFFIRIPPI